MATVTARGHRTWLRRVCTAMASSMEMPNNTRIDRRVGIRAAPTIGR